MHLPGMDPTTGQAHDLPRPAQSCSPKNRLRVRSAGLLGLRQDPDPRPPPWGKRPPPGSPSSLLDHCARVNVIDGPRGSTFAITRNEISCQRFGRGGVFLFGAMQMQDQHALARAHFAIDRNQSRSRSRVSIMIDAAARAQSALGAPAPTVFHRRAP